MIRLKMDISCFTMANICVVSEMSYFLGSKFKKQVKQPCRRPLAGRLEP